ncbi:sensor histidine kinase [Flagellimonas nanhaiensis]|uniref:Sensor histidine kinase n=1 Tax=Flagellimonas nanhaiensis TaxID=2292706 RepID=A0A371JSS6_9FLAO|nr:histidine kinase [Allomuricauda nanhaiensis]RDY60809.1 sensor histidine kinase [Allomuricauda nanhaiensis]
MDKKVIWGIKVKELLLVLSFYIVSAFFYHLTVWLSSSDFSNENITLLGVRAFIDGGGLQYGIFLLFTIPIWWLIFVKLKHQKLWKRLILHAFILPVFIYTSRIVYYDVCESLGWFHLEGSGQVWDLYIPALFYLIQFGIFHAYEHYRENQKKLKLEGELKQAALKSELAAIKAQLNPHFLYNVFNTINASVPAKQEETRRLIATLADLFRYQLKASKEELVSLKEELDFVKKYLELEKARFEERLKVKINVSQELYAEKIPPMLLQPLVENSVKHGISNAMEGGEISITIFKEAEKLRFEIADTGIGVKNKESIFNKGVGLTNTRLRLKKMYQSQIEVLDNQPQGLKIRFAL